MNERQAESSKEKEQTPEQLKWVWHKETCENPGDFIVIKSLHGFMSSWGDFKDHFDVVSIKCGDCGQTAQIKSELRECWCQVPQF